MKQLIHYLELKSERHIRIGGNSSSQALCSTGDAHQVTTRYFNNVTCKTCRDILARLKERAVTLHSLQQESE